MCCCLGLRKAVCMLVVGPGVPGIPRRPGLKQGWLMGSVGVKLLASQRLEAHRTEDLN